MSNVTDNNHIPTVVVPTITKQSFDENMRVNKEVQMNDHCDILIDTDIRDRGFLTDHLKYHKFDQYVPTFLIKTNEL